MLAMVVFRICPIVMAKMPSKTVGTYRFLPTHQQALDVPLRQFQDVTSPAKRPTSFRRRDIFRD